MESNMKFALSIFFAVLFCSKSFAEMVQISCGSSSGYSYYFLGGLVGKDNQGFAEDAISDGQFTLTVNDIGDGDVLARDASGNITSASSQGAKISIYSLNDRSMNWLLFYPDGTLENYALNFSSMQVAAWRNTVGNERVAKNSLMISDCVVR
jgi:hypothetical protein